QRTFVFSGLGHFRISSIEFLYLAACGEPHSHNEGACKEYHPRWSYDFVYKKCVFFIYGGCRGNNNRFDSLEECKERCVE
ncbi:hypothetical protein KR222_003278, partial [Zaprionus bogoriensis]